MQNSPCLQGEFLLGILGALCSKMKGIPLDAWTFGMQLTVDSLDVLDIQVLGLQALELSVRLGIPAAQGKMGVEFAGDRSQFEEKSLMHPLKTQTQGSAHDWRQVCAS